MARSRTSSESSAAADQPLDSPENFQLGKITVNLPPGRTQEQNKFALTYTYDTNGLLHVKAVIVRDGHVLLDREVQEFGERGSGSGVTPETLRAFLGQAPMSMNGIGAPV